MSLPVAVAVVVDVVVMVGVGVFMTVGVYGLVAAIVKIDDLGLFLSRPHKSRWQKILGLFLLKLAPYLMKFLGLAGTIAMFMVGGGIIAHNLEALHHTRETFSSLLQLGFDTTVGLITGSVVLTVVQFYKRAKANSF